MRYVQFYESGFTLEQANPDNTSLVKWSANH